MGKKRNINLSLFGAAPDTGNLGVSALCYATVINLIKYNNNVKLTAFDHGRGVRQGYITIADQEIKFNLQGAVNSRRYYRPENLWTMKALGAVGGLGNAGIKTIVNSHAVLDISGGDSFSDLYGPRRFNTVILPKLIALQQKRPLILLPQTYGPFATDKCRSVASDIVKKASVSWARDERSFEVLKKLVGNDFDPAKHKCGVDVAFGLPTVKPENVPDKLEQFYNSDVETIGINISGLIYNDPQKAKSQFKFKADYNSVVVKLIKRFLEVSDCNIALIPHVVTPRGHFESDIEACEAVLKTLPPSAKERICVVPAYNNPCEIKWVISKLDWFCGTRMHATIAALSSGVPVSAISYSPKTLGVFETCGQGEHVAEPRELRSEEVVEHVWRSWQKKDDALGQFEKYLPNVFAKVREQITSVLLAINGNNKI